VLLKRIIDDFDKGLEPVISLSGKIGGWALAVMMLLMVFDITGRYVFNKPITNTYEISSLLLILVSIFSLIYCQRKGGHISIDLVTSRFKESTRVAIDIAMQFLYFCTFILLTYQIIVKTLAELGTGSLIRNTEIPVFPFSLIVAIGSILFTLLIILYLLQLILRAVKR
jgi:TRAP-type transport system small permease protein